MIDRHSDGGGDSGGLDIGQNAPSGRENKFSPVKCSDQQQQSEMKVGVKCKRGWEQVKPLSREKGRKKGTNRGPDEST